MTLEEYEQGITPTDFLSRQRFVKSQGYSGTPKLVLNELLKGKTFTKKELDEYKYTSVSRLIYEIKLLGYEVIKYKQTAFNKAYTKYRLHSKHLSNG
jgi:hypothetical protein